MIEDDTTTPPAERPTPITDAAAFNVPCHGADGTGSRVAVVPFCVARDLERQLAEAREQRDRLAEALGTLENERTKLTSYEHPDAPGHSHLVLGHWDADGSRCSWCAAWDNARATLAAVKETT